MLVGQPPFDAMMTNKDLLVSQMVDGIGPLPDRWKDRYTYQQDDESEDTKLSLEDWLADLYFEEGKEPEVSHAELEAWGRLLRKPLRFEPRERASAADILQEECLA